MISESRYWKQPLLEMADRLEHLKMAGALFEQELAQVECDIFIGFYSVRKLLEAPAKITDETRRHSIHLHKNANLKSVTWRNNHHLDELYDLSTTAMQERYLPLSVEAAISSKKGRDVIFACGRIIPSYVFSPCMSYGGGLGGAFFSSDRDRDKCLYFISIDEVIALFRQVGNDDPCQIKWSRDPETRKETLIVK